MTTRSSRTRKLALYLTGVLLLMPVAANAGIGDIISLLTMTVVDWDGDGLEDLIICRFKEEAPGLKPAGRIVAIPSSFT